MNEGENDPVIGPALAALPEKMQTFVMSCFLDDCPRQGDGMWSWAAEQAGYSASSKGTLKSAGWRLAHDPKVVAAISEYARLNVRTVSPEAVRALKDLIRDPKNKNHFKAVDAVLGRVYPQQTSHVVTVEDNRATIDTQAVLKKIDELARKFGLLPEPKIIDGHAVEVREAS